MKRYEGLFLFDNASAHEWPEMEAEVRRLCERIQASLQACVKFDERKLAYEIKGRKRGTYVLSYFDAEPERVGELERDAQLSESILRVLVLRAEKVGEERLAELQAWPAEQPLQPISSEGRRGEGPAFRARPEPAAQHRTAPKEAETVAETTGKPDLETAAETTTAGGTEVKPESAAPAATDEPPAPETPDAKPVDN